MRKVDALSPIEARLAGLVHESVRGDPAERARHRRLVLARMTAGALALALLPPFLLWRGAPSLAEHLVLAATAAPLFAAAILTGTGRLALSQGVLSAGLALPIAALAASGGFPPAAMLLVLLLPAEALLSGSRAALLTGCGVTAASLAAVAILPRAGLGPLSPWLPALAVALALAGHAVAALLSRRPWAAAVAARDEASVLSTIDDLVTWHDRNGHVLEASAAATKLTGLPPVALLGRGLLARVHVSDRPAFLRGVGDAAASGGAVARFRLHAGPDHADGAGEDAVRDGEAPSRVLWVEMHAHRVAAPAGPAVIAVTRDITEHRRELDALDGARARAELSDRGKSRFLATVSHELRTPLNAVIGFSDLLAAEDGEARRREYAGIIGDSGRHLLDVASTLLDLSRMESGGFAFTPEPFDLGAVAHGACDLLSLKAEASGIALSRDIDPDLGPLVGDRRACRQILLNLLSNALKFTPRGGEARVGLGRDRDRIVLTVSDTGVGVRDGDLPRLGDPFFQAGEARSRSGGGAGLGLSITRGLVGLHRGTMAIDSAPGEGTRVTIGLPLDTRSGVRPASAPVSTLPRPRGRALAKAG